MFDLPRDTPMLLNGPANPVAAEANGPQSQVHAGDNWAAQSGSEWRAVAATRWLDAQEVTNMCAVNWIYDHAIRLANAEPSVPIPVADSTRSKADEHQELIRQITDRRSARG